MVRTVNVLNNCHHAKLARVLDEAEWALCAQLQLATLRHPQHHLVATAKFVQHIKGQQVSLVKVG